jgi:hypothetical protein
MSRCEVVHQPHAVGTFSDTGTMPDAVGTHRNQASDDRSPTEVAASSIAPPKYSACYLIVTVILFETTGGLNG